MDPEEAKQSIQLALYHANPEFKTLEAKAAMFDEFAANIRRKGL
jgi:hypothetical protein